MIVLYESFDIGKVFREHLGQTFGVALCNKIVLTSFFDDRKEKICKNDNFHVHVGVCVTWSYYTHSSTSEKYSRIRKDHLVWVCKTPLYYTHSPIQEEYSRNKINQSALVCVCVWREPRPYITLNILWYRKIFCFNQSSWCMYYMCTFTILNSSCDASSFYMLY